MFSSLDWILHRKTPSWPRPWVASPSLPLLWRGGGGGGRLRTHYVGPKGQDSRNWLVVSIRKWAKSKLLYYVLAANTLSPFPPSVSWLFPTLWQFLKFPETTSFNPKFIHLNQRRPLTSSTNAQVWSAFHSQQIPTFRQITFWKNSFQEEDTDDLHCMVVNCRLRVSTNYFLSLISTFPPHIHSSIWIVPPFIELPTLALSLLTLLLTCPQRQISFFHLFLFYSYFTPLIRCFPSLIHSFRYINRYFPFPSQLLLCFSPAYPQN